MFDLGLQPQEGQEKGATIPARIRFEPIKDSKLFKGIVEFTYNPDEDNRVRYINKKQSDGTLIKTQEVNNSRKGICILVNDKVGTYNVRGTGNFTFSLSK